MKKRAFTLAEVLIASAVFLSITASLLALYRLGLGARTRHEAHQKPHRAALQCISYLRNELRVVQLIQPSDFSPGVAPVQEILYRRPAFDGPLQFDGSGTPLWALNCKLSFEADHQLWRRPEGPAPLPRSLVNLGTGGLVQFRRLNDQLLSVDIRADFGDPKAVVQLHQNFLLPNQP